LSSWASKVSGKIRIFIFWKVPVPLPITDNSQTGLLFLHQLGVPLSFYRYCALGWVNFKLFFYILNKSYPDMCCMLVPVPSKVIKTKKCDWVNWQLPVYERSCFCGSCTTGMYR
jgi:hypothetical protein